MRIYTYGNKAKPELMLLPGNLIDGQEYYEEVLPYLLQSFHVILVSYSGFDGNDKTVFKDMKFESEMIEHYIKENYGGHLYAVYGSAIGGTFAALLMQRSIIRFDHVIIGGTDFDKVSAPAAFLQSRLFAPMFYKMIHSGEPNAQISKEMAHLSPKDPYIRQLHNDAKAKHLATIIAEESGFQAWQYGPCMTPEAAAELTHGKITMFGGLAPLELAKMTVEETEVECNRIIDEFKGNSRIVLGTMGSVNQVPVPNLLCSCASCG